MRDAEIKNLTWGQIDFEKQYLAVGRSKTEAGEGSSWVGRRAKSLKKNGSSGRTRTYNPSVNSRMLCH